jgi:predicted metal-dependent hydrolase
MAQRTQYVDGIGTVVLAKRRGTKHIRLSITARGDIRISVPYWAPYEAGIRFAKSRQDWILKQKMPSNNAVLKSGHRIGKAHTVRFVEGTALRSAIKGTDITVTFAPGQLITDENVQTLAKKASERALKKEAEKLLPQRLDMLAKSHGFQYKSVAIKKLHSRWGSCSNNQEIALSYYLMQLPWPLIDYVLLHELAHTKYMHHQSTFWELLGSLIPAVKEQRKEIKRYRPMVIPA